MQGKKCKIARCDNAATAARGMCPKHYQRLRVHGSAEIVLKKGRKPIDPAKRMMGFTERRDPDECWPWRGATSAGYGQISLSGRMVGAHRLAFMLAHQMSQLPEGMQVLHSCDNGVCVNPGHLRLGTHAENMADKKARGRARNGATGRLRPAPGSAG